jgi:ribosomal 30S subunit maturation factor RimM
MDLVGMTVVDGNIQEPIGTVVGIANEGNDLLEIEAQKAPGQKILVPMVKAFVKSLNLQTRQIELLTIPGLIPDPAGFIE